VEPNQRFVRQFALTKGRAQSHGETLPFDTLVTAVPGHRSDGPNLEYNEILRRSQDPISIAEISAHLGVHIGIARVLVSDMVFEGLVTIATAEFGDNGPDLRTLERLLHDLQAL
jgi:Protein of unknown function (DUF742)